MELLEILKKPVITEKSMKDAASGWYTFIVHLKANKVEIRQAVESQFKVKVLSVKTLITKGKSKRVGRRRQEVSQTPFKKAMVKLGPDEKLDLFEVSK